MYVILHALFISQEYWGKAHSLSAHWKREHSSTSAVWTCSFFGLQSLTLFFCDVFTTHLKWKHLILTLHYYDPFLCVPLQLTLWSNYLNISLCYTSPFLLFSVFCFVVVFFLRIIHSYLSSQSLFRQQPLIFLMLVCYIKVSKRVVREPVSSVIYDYCSSSGITGRTEQNTKISRETKANVKCHKPLVSKGSLQ